MNPSAASSIRATAVRSRRATWWSGSCAARTRFPAPTARWASGTCAATASTPSAGSRRSTASCRNAGAASPSTLIKVDPSLGILGVLLEPMTVITKALEQVFADRPARLLGTQDRAGDRRGADRPAGGAAPGVRTDLRFTCSIVSKPGRSPSSCGISARRIIPAACWISASSRTSIVECTGVGSVIADSIQKVGAGGIVCLTGVGAGGARGQTVADVAAAAVLKNNVIVGSVNANKRHWYKAGAKPGPLGPELAEPGDHALREAGEFPAGARATTRRRQGGHPVQRGLMEDVDMVVNSNPGTA